MRRRTNSGFKETVIINNMESSCREINLKPVEELRREWEEKQLNVPQFIELVNSLWREPAYIWIPGDLLEKINLYLSECSGESIEQTLHVLDRMNS